MVLSPNRIDTPIATVERTAAGMVEVYFKAGSTLSVGGITALLDAREQMAGQGPTLVLIVFPPTEMDFDMAMITRDHYRGRPVQEHSKAIAWVTRNEHNDRFTRLYFAYFPSPVPAAIFAEVEEARAWLAQQG